MRILWFSPNSSCYSNQRNAHNGGGWVASLEKIIRQEPAVQLGVAFLGEGDVGINKVVCDAVTYYPMVAEKKGWLPSLKKKLLNGCSDELILQMCVSVIEDFKPDLIHVFGSEWCYGLLYKETDVPIVIHFQGSWPAYRNAEFPPGFSFSDEIIKRMFRPWAILNYLKTRYFSKKRADREEEILSHTKYFMGRTRWDKALCKLYSPDAKYFYCSEALRREITACQMIWNFPGGAKKTIVSLGAGTYLKGYDLILKTAKLMKQWRSDQFVWLLLGPTERDMKCFERKTGIKCLDVGVIAMGRKSAEDVRNHLLKADVFVHASYIDNSPNSVCEAQYLGVPVIATNVGGSPSLFSKAYPLDFLVPTNDPYYLASKISEVLNNHDLALSLSIENMRVAKARHDELNIKKDLMTAYEQIIGAGK